MIRHSKEIWREIGRRFKWCLYGICIRFELSPQNRSMDNYKLSLFIQERLKATLPRHKVGIYQEYSSVFHSYFLGCSSRSFQTSQIPKYQISTLRQLWKRNTFGAVPPNNSSFGGGYTLTSVFDGRKTKATCQSEMIWEGKSIYILKFC